MEETPATRPSLLARIRDPRDERAWREFAEIYGPLLVRLARANGLQEADASDLAQEVFRSVARSVEGHGYDPARGSFRGWLFGIAQTRRSTSLPPGEGNYAEPATPTCRTCSRPCRHGRQRILHCLKRSIVAASSTGPRSVFGPDRPRRPGAPSGWPASKDGRRSRWPSALARRSARSITTRAASWPTSGVLSRGSRETGRQAADGRPER